MVRDNFPSFRGWLWARDLSPKREHKVIIDIIFTNQVKKPPTLSFIQLHTAYREALSKSFFSKGANIRIICILGTSRVGCGGYDSILFSLN